MKKRLDKSITSVMWLILDLDQPRRGAIKASQHGLFDLYQDLSQDARKSF